MQRRMFSPARLVSRIPGKKKKNNNQPDNVLLDWCLLFKTLHVNTGSQSIVKESHMQLDGFG